MKRLPLWIKDIITKCYSNLRRSSSGNLCHPALSPAWWSGPVWLYHPLSEDSLFLHQHLWRRLPGHDQHHTGSVLLCPVYQYSIYYLSKVSFKLLYQVSGGVMSCHSHCNPCLEMFKLSEVTLSTALQDFLRSDTLWFSRYTSDLGRPMFEYINICQLQCT